MLSGAELNQLLMPAKFGAVLCRAAIATGAVSPEMPGLAVAIRQSAAMQAEVASDRGVMGVSFFVMGRVKGRSGPADRTRSATPRSACRIGNRTAPRRR